MVEGARLESVYRSKAYRGFESLSLRQSIQKLAEKAGFFVITASKARFCKYCNNKKDKRCAAALLLNTLLPPPKGSRAIASNPIEDWKER